MPNFVTLTSTLSGHTLGIITIDIVPPTQSNPFNREIKCGATKLAHEFDDTQWLIIGANHDFSQLDIQLLDLDPDGNDILPIGTKLFIFNRYFGGTLYF
jgi:hypothetical protein